MTNRHFTPDVIRGLACLLMATFHFGFDLGQFQLIYFSFQHPFWEWFRYLIVTLFLSMVGYGLHQAYHRQIVARKVAVRFAKVGGAALIISIATYFFARDSWVFFGILHFIALASVILLPMVRFPKLSLILGISIMLIYALRHAVISEETFCQSSVFWLQFKCITSNYNEWAIANQVWFVLPSKTLDMLKFFPWIGMVMIGIWLGKVNLLNLAIAQNRVTNGIAFLGRHSLVFYLLHQGLLFPIAWGIYWLTTLS